ncbi:MBL fold metallo-hydrolase [Halorhabdus rudnickae]|uniref:MBL fold metallo-hydrolase n=1 Tax=Halorhabdus rudnickae TaxID=1775544 RepID=UPI001083E902|nr:MBL fold metallo-hydrolase [Halorhabdus rudnickae]
MNVSFQIANPRHGRESYLIRLHGDNGLDQPTCILVDSGEGVDVDSLLDDGEYLHAVLLTHAHFDHYCSLGSNLRDGAPVFATPETVKALQTRLDLSSQDLSHSDEIRQSLEPTTGWRLVTEDARVHPVPAGHAPGACGFNIQFREDGENYHLLATGDFTTRRAAGYPGFRTDIPADAVFITGATSHDYEDTLTEAVSTIKNRADAGSPVLVTASGTNGIQLAYLLAQVSKVSRVANPITVAGRVAQLWKEFGYDHPEVEAVPEFDDPVDLLGPERITIAGPASPVAGSSKEIFDVIGDRGEATLVQVTDGGSDPIQSASCTIHDYTLRNHPTEETIDDVVHEFEPVHVIITHQQGQGGRRFKDRYNSFVWAIEDGDPYTLFDDGWEGPPWVTRSTIERVKPRFSTEYRANGTLDTTEMPLPTVERHEDIDLAAEGLNLDRLSTETGIDVRALEMGEPIVEAQGGSADAGGSETGDDQGPVEEILTRLDDIEDALQGTEARATVIDTNEGTVLFRLEDADLAEQLSRGQTLDVSFSDPLSSK